MAYTINLTDGTIFAVVADGTINTDSSQTIVGKNYAGYGEFLGENFIRLLENAANTSSPGAPLTGQLWYDKTNNVIKVYNGTLFKSISGATASTSTPTSNVAGDLWFDTTNDQLKVYSGSAFVTIGPAFTSGEGTSGAIVDTITDSSPGNDHVVVLMYVNNTIVSIFSKDPTFTPAAAISGFATIGPGLNMSTTVSNAVFNGTASNADQLDSLNSTSFMRTDAATSNDTSLSVLNDTGIYFGADNDGRLNVSGTDVYLQNQTQDGNILVRVNDGGVQTTAMTIDGATSNVNINTNATVTGNITASYLYGNGSTLSGIVTSVTQIIDGTSNVSVVSSGGNVDVNIGATKIGEFNSGGLGIIGISNRNADGVGNIGASGAAFNTVHALATSAQYADMAERFHADAEYTAGTVVELGGENEVTLCIDELSDKVFGVVSDKPAYLMNGGAGSDATHPAIAMTGRVPVMTMGFVTKGDRLVSAGNGVARAATLEEVTAFNVIGRALTDKTSEGIDTVEAIVKIA
jgi:hypothetical protein